VTTTASTVAASMIVGEGIDGRRQAEAHGREEHDRPGGFVVPFVNAGST